MNGDKMDLYSENGQNYNINLKWEFYPGMDEYVI